MDLSGLNRRIAGEIRHPADPAPQVYLNDGKGDFSLGQQFDVGNAGMVGVALADFNGDAVSMQCSQTFLALTKSGLAKATGSS